MPTTSPSSDLDIDLLDIADSDALVLCECRHGDRPEDLCGAPATLRVTVICVAEDCDCAAGVYLLCGECVSAWEDDAGADGIQLRVTPL